MFFVRGIIGDKKQDPLTPAEDAEAVDHGSVGVRAHYTVRVNETLAFLHHARQVLQINLMHCANVWRNHGHVLKRSGTPLRTSVTRDAMLPRGCGTVL